MRCSVVYVDVFNGIEGNVLGLFVEFGVVGSEY